MKWTRNEMIREMFPDITGRPRILLDASYVVAFGGLGLFAANEWEPRVVPSTAGPGDSVWWYLGAGLLAVVLIASIARTLAFIPRLVALIAGLNFMILAVDLIHVRLPSGYPKAELLVGLLCIVLSIKSFGLANRSRSPVDGTGEDS